MPNSDIYVTDIEFERFVGIRQKFHYQKNDSKYFPIYKEMKVCHRMPKFSNYSKNCVRPRNSRALNTEISLTLNAKPLQIE